jgi:cytochrome c oxidase cbb3-type subunit 2
LDQDKAFGRPSAEGDFAYQTPELLGSERTGPDLTNIGVRQPSSVWQYIHLYDPRAVVPDSIMPSFNWLFEVTDRAPTGASSVPVPKAYAPVHGVVIPSHQAQALVAYLAALKQPPLAVGASAKEQASDAEPDRATPVVASIPIGSLHPTVVADSAKGARLFTSNCSACHQANGEGVPGAFPSLKGDAAVNDSNGARQIQVVLNGLHDADVGGVVYASVMPPFSGTLSDAEIADIIDYERSSWGNHGKPVDAAQVATERAKGN